MSIKKITILIIFLILGIQQIWAQPEWSVDQRQFENSMTITGVIVMNGEESREPGNIVGVFVNGECRGVGNVTYIPDANRCMVFLTVYGNSTDENEDINFKIYWNETGRIYYLTELLSFYANTTVGSPEDPYQWNIIDLPIEGETTNINGCIGTSYEIFSTPGCSPYLWNTGEVTASIDVTWSGTFSCTRYINDTARIIHYWIVDLQAAPVVVLGADTTICSGENIVLDLAIPA